MNKPIFDDIVPPENEMVEENGAREHSIRNVEIESSSRDERRARRAERRVPFMPEDTEAAPAPRKSKRLWFVAATLVVVALLGVSFVFIGKTTITITPIEENITLASNMVHTAYLEPEVGELGFFILSHTATAEKEVASNGSEYVEEKASGTIIVYNDFSSASQRLIKNTRFETPDGMIYRIRNSLVVPGQHKDSNGKTVPGSIEVTVYADEAGGNYNKDSATFTIPGLKGDERYEFFSAKTTSALAGGFAGERPVVDDATIASVRAELQQQLEGELKDYIAMRGEDALTFDDAVFISYTDVDPSYAGDSAIVSESARLQAIAFKTNELARALAGATLASATDGELSIDPDTLANARFRLVNRDDFDPNTDTLAQFTIDGSLTLVWDIDIDALKRDLVGKNSAALQTIMSSYPGIDSAEATIRPFWKNAFPTDESNITVNIIRKGN